jgi:hypothetical protein
MGKTSAGVNRNSGVCVSNVIALAHLSKINDLSRSGVFSAHHQCTIEIIFGAHIFVYSHRFFLC